MSMTQEIKLMKDAQISVLFQLLEGYLLGPVFVEVENGRIKNVYSQEENLQLVPTALYEVEKEIDSLGLDLKNNPFDRSLIEEKLIDAFNVQTVELEFDVINEGTEVDTVVESLSESENDDTDHISETNENEEAVEGKEEEESIASILSDAAAELETQVEQTDLFENQVEDKEDVVNEDDAENGEIVIPDGKLSRSEKQSFTKILSLEFLAKSSSAINKLQFVAAHVQEKIDVSDTHVRNMLEELIEEGKVLKIGRGKYSLKAREGEEMEAVSQEDDKVQNKGVSNQVPTVPSVSEVAPVSKATSFPCFFNEDEKIREFLSRFDIPTPLLNWVMKTREANRNRVREYPQDIVDTIAEELDYIGNEKVLRKSLAAMMVDQPLSLKGPAGTGKTTIIATISAVLNYPLFVINGSLESNKATLVGELDIKEQGVLSVKDGQMTKAAIYGGKIGRAHV